MLVVVVMVGIEMVPKLLHLSSTAGTTIMLPFFPLCLLDHAYHVEFQLVKKSLDVTVLFLMYMDKLVCINSDRNQE